MRIIHNRYTATHLLICTHYPKLPLTTTCQQTQQESNHPLDALPMLFNPTTVVIEQFIEELVDHYVKMYGQNETDTQLVIANARNALEIIANSDAPYHDVNHTIMVTTVGMEILRGKILIEGSVSAKSWAHFVVSLLHHDIGYVRGICRADRSGRYAINKDMDTVTPPPGATDAFLSP